MTARTKPEGERRPAKRKRRAAEGAAMVDPRDLTAPVPSEIQAAAGDPAPECEVKDVGPPPEDYDGA